MKKRKDVVNLTPAELEELKVRISMDELREDDRKILLSILSIYFWVQNQLESTKLSIHRLKKIFGFKTEKKPSTKPLEIDPENKMNSPIDKASLPTAQTQTIIDPETSIQKK